MPAVNPKHIRHLGRYFAILSVLLFFGYHSSNSIYLLIALGPTYFMVPWLRFHGGFILSLIPNEPEYNHYLLLLPATLGYFGLVGFLLKNLINERGLIRLVSLMVFLAFLGYIHYMSYREISLYFVESTAPAIKPLTIESLTRWKFPGLGQEESASSRQKQPKAFPQK